MRAILNADKFQAPVCVCVLEGMTEASCEDQVEVPSLSDHHRHISSTHAISTGSIKKKYPLAFFADFSETAWNFNTKFYTFIHHFHLSFCAKYKI